MALLNVSQLSVTFTTDSHRIHAVRGLSFSLAPGERLGLVGESGSGKTSVALALMRMIAPPARVTGQALLEGRDLLALSEAEARAARLATVAYVPQGSMNSLNPVLTVAAQILDGLTDHGLRLDRAAARARVEQALEGVGLPPAVAGMYPHQLSGGMKQRVCIAIATAMQPRLIIADEPTSALDVITQKRVVETLVGIQNRIGCGLILIGHDMGLMAQAVHRVLILRDGEAVEDAPVRRIFARPQAEYSRHLIDSVPRLGNRIAADDAPVAPANPGGLIRFEDVSRRFAGPGGGSVALYPSSFAFDDDRPRIIALVGRSGSGKTTTARIVLGLDRPSSGRARVLGRDVAALRGADRLRHHQEVQLIPQDPYRAFNPFYRVRHTLSDPARRLGLHRDRDALRDAMLRACAAVGLRGDQVLDRFPHELSGGQRQRLLVARTLLLNPRLIVADEPVSMVDASLRMSILSSLQALKRDHGISILYITHDLATAYQISDHMVVMEAGRIVEGGSAEQVMKRSTEPHTRRLIDAIPWPDPDRPWLAGAPAPGHSPVA